MKNQQFHGALESFIRYLGGRGRAALTLEHYRSYLLEFAKTAVVNGTSDITLKRVEGFKRHLHVRDLSPATQNYYLIALRNFIRWLPTAEQPINYKSIELAPTSPRTPTRASRSSITRLLDAPMRAQQSSTLLSLRDRALLELLHDTPLRLHQLPNLQRKHFDRARGSMHIRNSQDRTIIKLSLHAQRALENYLNARTDAHHALFIAHDRSQKRQRRTETLSTRSIQRAVAKYSARIGLAQQITPRVLQKNSRVG